MKPFLSGKSAFVHLEKLVNELQNSAADEHDVVVILLPQNSPISEIRYAEPHMIFRGYPDDSGQQAIFTRGDGEEFLALVNTSTVSPTRRVTRFIDHSCRIRFVFWGWRFQQRPTQELSLAHQTATRDGG